MNFDEDTPARNTTRNLQIEPLETRRLLAADLTPFDGSSNLYQIHGNNGAQGQLSIIDVANSTFQDVGQVAGFKINATGYRVADNFIYGIKVTSDQLIRLGADGRFEILGKIEGLPNRNYYSADFGGDGLLYIWSGKQLFGVNVDTVSVEREVTLSRKMSSTPDLAYDPVSGLMFGVERTSNRTRSFISIDYQDGQVQTINSNFEPSNGTFGAMFADATGRVFGADNRGGLYEIDKENGIAELVGYSPRASSNDGSSPSSAAVNLPPMMERSWVTVEEGAVDVPLELPTPVDPENELFSITVAELPNGTVKLLDGTALSVGDQLFATDVPGLLYDAPSGEEAETPGEIVFDLSDGNSVSYGIVELKISGQSRLTGHVSVIHDADDDTFGGYAFNNQITLRGVNFRGESVERSTPSDEWGYYEFLDLEAGEYEVVQEQPGTVHDGFVVPGELGGVEGENKITGIEIPVGPGKSYEGYDFSELAPAAVSGFTYNDEDGDQLLGSLDDGMSRVDVQLIGVDDLGVPFSATTRTGRFGFYEFSGLRPGTYEVVQLQPEDFVSSASNVGSHDGEAFENQISNIAIFAGSNAQHYDFGELESAILSGHVYVDYDFDKVRDLGDAGIEGVEVSLSGTDIFGNEVLLTAQTNADGQYRFVSLVPGTYQIVEEQPEIGGLKDSRENLGAFVGLPGSIARNGIRGEDEFTQIQLLQGDEGKGYDFTETVAYYLATEFDEVLEIVGSDSDDFFRFEAGSENHTLELNGLVWTIDAATTVNLRFDGLGGNDTVELVGTSNVEQVTLQGQTAVFQSETFRIDVNQTEQISVDHGGGFDRAFLRDTVGNDKLKATESYVRMWGEEYYNQANGFHRTYAYATEGDDQAYMHDSKKDDTFKASEDRARMFSRKYYNLADGFDRVYAYANSGGEDSAVFWDSPSNEDIFEAYPTYARMFNDNMYNSAEGFEVVTAHASEGGENDRAYLFDSNGDDILVSSPSESGMTGAGFSYQVYSFERMYAHASEGNDRAYLYDSHLDDKYLSFGDNVRLYNDDYYLRANDFDQVDAYSSEGGNDRAYFYDTVGADTFIALENEIRMYGEGFDNTSHNFSRAYAFAENGGEDVAYLYDTDQADTLRVGSESTRMYGDGYYTRVAGFEAVNSEFTSVSNQDRAMVFGTVGEETLDAAGRLGEVITEYGATYVRNADTYFGNDGSDNDDDGDAGNTNDEFEFIPEKRG